MKLYRSALMAGLVAIGVGACGDDVQIVEPTPPPLPPLTATMAPASATVAVGNSVVFAVNASGGAAGAQASWTCASSNTGIATASDTGAGCQATGVAAGGVTITAAVTKGSETVNVGAQLTVTSEEVVGVPGDPAFLIVASITDGSDDDDTLSGRVSVVLNVERGDQTLEELSVFVDGEIVATQAFGTGMALAPPEDEAAEQAVHSFTLAFDTDGYDPATGAPDYPNGEHTISAELIVAGGMMADGTMGRMMVASNIVPSEFDNTDGVYVALSGLGAGALEAATGQRWYGGPAAALTITALPVLYSGGSASAVGIGEFCEADAETATGPFVFTPECEGTSGEGGATAQFTVDGDDIGVLNSGVFPLYLDFEGPSAPTFSPNPNGREDGWVNNLGTGFFTAQHATRNKDGWLTFNDDDAGVGGYQPVLRYAEADDASVEDAVAASPVTLATLPGESEEDAYCVVVSATDLLGNESGLPDEDGDTCLIAGVAGTLDEMGEVDEAATEGSYEALLQDLAVANAMADDGEGVTTKANAVEAATDALADAGLLAGVDLTPPGIELEADDRFAADPGADEFDFDIYDDEHDDYNSGLHETPLTVSAQRRGTSKTDCLDIGDGEDGTTNGEVTAATAGMDCDDPTSLTDVAIAFDDPADAYYTLWGTARDKAGNSSETVSHTFVVDATPAAATALAAPGSIDAGEAFQIASFLNDNLSLRDYYVAANFPNNIELGFVHPTVVDAFDADPLTYRNHAVTVDVETYAGVAPANDIDNAEALDGVTVAVRNQGQQGQTPYTEVAGTFIVGDPDDNFTANFTVALSIGDALCVADDIDDCEDANDDRETELEFVATAAATGSFSDPFDQVDFWVQDVNGTSWMIGSDTSGASGRVSATDRTRTWTYSLDVSAADLYMLTREAGFLDLTGLDDTHTVHAFGVNDDDVAVTANAEATIDDGETDQ